MIEQQMQLLVTVKAYPQPSRTYGETVCVAGVRTDNDVPTWIRIYPVAYRDLSFTDRFRKYQLMNLRAFRASSDQRPESYKPNIPSAQLGEFIGADHGWRDRWKYLGPLAGATTACELYAQQDDPTAPSLGLIKPRLVDRLDIEPNDAFSEDKQRLADLAAAGDLFNAERSALEPAPYRLKYHYFCMTSGCNGHNQTLIDWEAGQAARNWKPPGVPMLSCQIYCGRSSSASCAGPTATPTSSSAISTSTDVAFWCSVSSGPRPAAVPGPRSSIRGGGPQGCGGR